MRPGLEHQLLTIGYEGRTADELINELAGAGVDVLVDVRLTPVSRKQGMSKRGLSAALAEAGLRYLHLPALGNPKDNRDGFRAGDASSRSRFADLLRLPEAAAALGTVEELVKRNHVALLCFERDAHTCHRQIVGDELARRTSAVNIAHA